MATGGMPHHWVTFGELGTCQCTIGLQCMCSSHVWFLYVEQQQQEEEEEEEEEEE
jgi:hypothetical protein